MLQAKQDSVWIVTSDDNEKDCGIGEGSSVPNVQRTTQHNQETTRHNENSPGKDVGCNDAEPTDLSTTRITRARAAVMKAPKQVPSVPRPASKETSKSVRPKRSTSSTRKKVRPQQGSASTCKRGRSSRLSEAPQNRVGFATPISSDCAAEMATPTRRVPITPVSEDQHNVGEGSNNHLGTGPEIAGFGVNSPVNSLAPLQAMFQAFTESMTQVNVRLDKLAADTPRDLTKTVAELGLKIVTLSDSVRDLQK